MSRGKRRILVFLVFSVLCFLTGLVVLVWRGLVDHPGKADVALVLGNQVNPDGSPSPRLKARLDTAVDFYRAGHYPKVIVSGATGAEGVPEGSAMRRYLLDAGIPDGAILVDDQGYDTQASVDHAVSIMKRDGMKGVFVVTQFFHVPRCRMALARQGVSPVYHASPSYFELRDLYSTVRECPAYLVYLFRKHSPQDEGDVMKTLRTDP